MAIVDTQSEFSVTHGFEPLNIGIRVACLTNCLVKRCPIYMVAFLLHIWLYTSELPCWLLALKAWNPNIANLDLILDAEPLSPNKPNLDMTLPGAEALSPNKPNLDMTLPVAEALSPNTPNLGMTLAVAEALTNQTLI